MTAIDLEKARGFTGALPGCFGTRAAARRSLGRSAQSEAVAVDDNDQCPAGLAPLWQMDLEFARLSAGCAILRMQIV